jgi:hypothetical protein
MVPCGHIYRYQSATKNLRSEIDSMSFQAYLQAAFLVAKQPILYLRVLVNQI